MTWQYVCVWYGSPSIHVCILAFSFFYTECDYRENEYDVMLLGMPVSCGVYIPVHDLGRFQDCIVHLHVGRQRMHVRASCLKLHTNHSGLCATISLEAPTRLYSPDLAHNLTLSLASDHARSASWGPLQLLNFARNSCSSSLANAGAASGGSSAGAQRW